MRVNLVIITVEELKNLLKEVALEIDSEKQAKIQERKEKEALYSINQVAKRLKRAHSTIKTMVAQGILSTTPDGLISERAIQEYLKDA